MRPGPKSFLVIHKNCCNLSGFVLNCKGENTNREIVMAEIFEIIMILSFGASWPLNVIKSYKARTTKGKSLGFLLLIFFGYIAGIISKFVNEAYMAEISSKWYVLFFYFLNFIMVGADLVLYVRNSKLDKKAGKEA